MNNPTKILIRWIIAIAMIAAIGYAGTCDFRQEVIYSMSQELYRKVLIDLGGTASEKEICDKYLSEKSKYDSLNI